MHLKQTLLICAVIVSAPFSRGTTYIAVDPYQKRADAVYDELNESLSRFRRQKSPETEAECRERIAMLECMLGTLHPKPLMSRHQLAHALEVVGRHKEAGDEYRALIAIYDRPQSELGTYELGLRASFGRTLLMQGKVPDAERESREALATAARNFGPAYDVTLEIRKTLARCLISQGRYAEALNELSGMATVIATALWTNRERILEDRIRLTLNRGVALGIALSNQGNHGLAEMVYRALVALPVEKLKGGERLAVSNRVRLAGALEAQGKFEESEKEWQAALAGRNVQRDFWSTGHFFSGIFTTCLELANCLDDQHHYKGALKFARRAKDLLSDPLGRNHLGSSWEYNRLRTLLDRLEATVRLGHPPNQGASDFILGPKRRDAVSSLNRAINDLNRSLKRPEPEPTNNPVK